jgi:transposase
VERILSVVATCRRQNVNVLDYLTQCYQSQLDDTPTPSLIPPPAATQAA